MQSLTKIVLEISFRVIFYSSNLYFSHAVKTMANPTLVMITNIVLFEIVHFVIDRFYKPNFSLQENIENKKILNLLT
jgi:hypothetical protein